MVICSALSSWVLWSRVRHHGGCHGSTTMTLEAMEESWTPVSQRAMLETRAVAVDLLHNINIVSTLPLNVMTVMRQPRRWVKKKRVRLSVTQ